MLIRFSTLCSLCGLALGLKSATELDSKLESIARDGRVDKNYFKKDSSSLA
jgi:hypothetical protein